MTPEKAKDLLPVFTAFAQGKAIQRYTPHLKETVWEDVDPPIWVEKNIYRIKPGQEYQNDQDRIAELEQQLETIQGAVSGAISGPAEPTQEMIDAGVTEMNNQLRQAGTWPDRVKSVYKAMRQGEPQGTATIATSELLDIAKRMALALQGLRDEAIAASDDPNALADIQDILQDWEGITGTETND